MKPIIILLTILLCGCAGTLDKFKLSYDRPKADDYWMERNPPSEPQNMAEILAVRSAAKVMTVKSDGMTAFYDREDGLNQLVRLEQISRSEDDSTFSVKYRISNGLIIGETVPVYTDRPNQEKEAYAREIAINAANGNAPNIPVLFNGRAFIAKYVGTCNVDVVEKDQNKIYHTYHVSTCQDVLAIASIH